MLEMPINKGFSPFRGFIKATKIFLFALFFSLSAPIFAGDSHSHHEDSEHGNASGKFEPGKMIMEHIKDAYDWHIMDINEHPVSIPLPVIVYHPENGFDLFSSANFDHGHKDYKGYRLVENKSQYRYVLATVDGSNFYNFSLTKNAISILIAAILLLFIFLSIAKAYRVRTGKAPKGIQSLIEPILLFIRDEVAKPSIGKGYEKFVPFLLTMFFFIWISNLFGLIPFFPGGANVTGNISVTLVLAAFTFLITTFSGNKYYWKHIFLPDVPVWLYPLMIPIEIIGVLLKPLVLMLRLFANITAGHIIILGFFSLIFIFGEMSQGLGLGVGAFSVAFTVFMSLLELLVAFLQAYVFTLLSALYFGMATEEHHHAEEHH
jgi:F-type H+-transporting ATPase subunit a